MEAWATLAAGNVKDLELWMVLETEHVECEGVLVVLEVGFDEGKGVEKSVEVNSDIGQESSQRWIRVKDFGMKMLNDGVVGLKVCEG